MAKAALLAERAPEAAGFSDRSSAAPAGSSPSRRDLVINPELRETLMMVAQAAADAADDWWIIGSAAVVLHGRKVERVKDIDLMMSAPDAEQLLRRVGGSFRSPDESARFRSAVFGVWSAPPIPVEVFGSFRLAVGGGWRDVTLETREVVTVGGARLFVPSRGELVRVLREFGRAKDLQRASLLERG